MVGRAALNIPGTKESYFFKGDKYVRYEWTPGTTDDKVTYGPTEFVKEWESLKQAGFKQIDAICPVPGQDRRAYFFCGDKYARIEYKVGAPGDKIIGEVKAIHDGWPSLKKAGFDHVDGALPVPGRPNEVYIFCGEQYCRSKITEGVANDELLDGPKPITVGWSATKFQKVDTVIARPDNEKNAYFFCDDKYSQFEVVVGGTDKLISDHRDVAPYWPGLHKAGFY